MFSLVLCNVISLKAKVNFCKALSKGESTQKSPFSKTICFLAIVCWVLAILVLVRLLIGALDRVLRYTDNLQLDNTVYRTTLTVLGILALTNIVLTFFIMAPRKVRYNKLPIELCAFFFVTSLTWACFCFYEGPSHGHPFDKNSPIILVPNLLQVLA
jgi:FlaA1/EpsC-like NDP-sugar epimerase